MGALLRRRDAGGDGGGNCHRNAPFVFIVDKIGSVCVRFTNERGKPSPPPEAVVAGVVWSSCGYVDFYVFWERLVVVFVVIRCTFALFYEAFFCVY